MAQPIDQLENFQPGILRQRLVRRAGGDGLRRPVGRRLAEHHDVGERIRPQPVGAMHGGAGRFATGEQPRHDGIGIALARADDLGAIIRWNAAHVVVRRRNDRDRLLQHIHPGENARRFGNARQALADHLLAQMVEVQVDVIPVLPHPAPFADLDHHGTADHVTRGQILGMRGIALHEALAQRIGEIAALTAHAFGNEDAGAIDAGGMELHELHVLHRQACAHDHGRAIAGADMGGGAGEINAVVAAGGEDDRMRPEAVNAAILQ